VVGDEVEFEFEGPKDFYDGSASGCLFDGRFDGDGKANEFVGDSEQVGDVIVLLFLGEV
jgi:hypothetical protein